MRSSLLHATLVVLLVVVLAALWAAPGRTEPLVVAPPGPQAQLSGDEEPDQWCVTVTGLPLPPDLQRICVPAP